MLPMVANSVAICKNRAGARCMAKARVATVLTFAHHLSNFSLKTEQGFAICYINFEALVESGG